VRIENGKLEVLRRGSVKIKAAAKI
jgi:hypothetical protein